MKAFKTLFCTCVVASVAHQAHGEFGLIKALRGDNEVPKYQRVAFVGSAIVKETKGTTERLCKVETWEPLAEGAHLQPGELIRTQSGEIVLKMAESGSFVRVSPNTILRLVPLEKDSVLSGSGNPNGFIVRSCRGIAFYRKPTGAWKQVLVNTVLAENSLIHTEPDATVDLFSTVRGRPVRVEGGTRELSLAEADLIQAPSQSGLASVKR